MDARLRSVIEQVYTVFAGDRPRTLVEACTHCVEPAEVQALTAVPLRGLTTGMLERYAAKAMTTWGTADDYRHFLPRILELAALGLAGGSHGLSWLGVASKFAMAGCERPWSAAERAALSGYAEALWQAELAGPARANFDGEFLALARAVGTDVPTLLDGLRSPLDADSAALFVALLNDLLAGLGEGGPATGASPRQWMFAARTAALVDEVLVDFPDTAAELDKDYEAWRACEPGG